MELFFLAILIITMVVALGSGFPVAFSLPGSAIFTIVLAAIFGVVFEGDSGAYFAQGDPIQWLNAGITNFRGIYWEAERDTLIAIPLFVFMGIMLERSKIAEDLLMTMAQLFGPVPGGLGISVVFVGALLAATTGIVGATVIAMGLISLPVMLRNNYSKSLATGTIAASGTLGQIIPPSIVLIILADQLSSATDQAGTIRLAEYKAATGTSSMPNEFGLTSTSAGDMFLGAFLPGLVLVGLYILYILVVALIRPKLAPAIPFEGKYDSKFAFRVFLVLVPPLALIVAVLGSIILGIATVNQAGAIGAVGAMIMAGYRLKEGQRGAYIPAIMAVVSIFAILVLINIYDINIKSTNTREDVIVVVLALVAVLVLLVSVAWSGWRTYKAENTLQWVMVETAKTSALVFIILLGAAMLTAAFRAFGGEELVRHFLSGLPGGFWGKFVVVMTVIFVLGFFLDFIEIAVVVVPIIAPILLADPSANITAVWLGVMIGVNMQTSFLTPPFGFALFYLRGVSPPEVKTLAMYKGVIPFILLQLLGLGIVGVYPSLVNYLPNSVYLTSETAPPPKNPRLQYCIEENVFAVYDANADALRSSIAAAKALDTSYLPDKYRSSLADGFKSVESTFDRVAKVREAETAVAEYVPEYRPRHLEVRAIHREIAKVDARIAGLEQRFGRRSRAGAEDAELAPLKERIDAAKAAKAEIEATIPATWEAARKTYLKLAADETKARRLYRRGVDDAYEPVAEVRKIIDSAATLSAAQPKVEALKAIVASEDSKAAMAKIREVESVIGAIPGASKIKSALSKARRAMKGDNPKREKAAEELEKGLAIFITEATWRNRAATELSAGFAAYDDAIRETIGLRLQERLTNDQAGDVASCLSIHRDISLNF